VLVRTEEPLGEFAERVREIFPDATILDVQEDCAATRVEVLSSADGAAGAEESFSDLFREYLKGRRLQGARPERVFAAFDSILQALDAEEEVVFPEDQLLEAPAEPPAEAMG
jgi:exonuclease SbcD